MGGNPDAEQGYILQIAVITFLVVIIGVAAYASRTTSGFFGAINQSINREARDTAESAITEFQDSLNRLENRYLLVKGDSSWSATDASLKNPCASTTVNVNGIPDVASAPFPSAAVISRFSPDASLNAASFKNLISSDNSRTFVVEKVEYIYDRDPSSGLLGRLLPGDSGYDWSSLTASGRGLYDGGTRTLLRVTVVARVTKNGVVSQSRVAREFEIVPKCCNRSFGNTYGGKNWGRDSGECNIIKEVGSGNGLITIGGLSTGASGTAWRITDQNGNPVTQAKCWAGNGGEPSSLTGTPTTTCLNNSIAFTGSPGTTFTPAEFALTVPSWPTSSDSGLPAPTVNTQQEASLTGNATYYLYFNPTLQRLCVRRLASVTATVFSSSPNCSGSSFQTLLGSSTPTISDPCSYKNVSYPWGTPDPGIPYYEVSCRLRNLNTSNNTNVIIDTTNMKLNLHFDSTSYTGEYMGGGGGTTFVRRHCRRTAAQLSSPPSNLSAPCTTDTTVSHYTASGDCPELARVNPSDPSQTQRLSCPRAYNIAELLNIYATGTGSFDMKGGNSTVGFNLVAPYADVTLRGGGSADPNFMGRILAENIALNGNIKIRTLSSNPSYCDTVGVACPPTGGPPYFDFIARSFSHASGF